jgi:hypothetical protein
MLEHPTIPKTPPADPALDQRTLFARGLAHVRDLSRRIWTDHNLHDPGVTTLELLSYALTDLSYRASFPVEDLLASGSASSEERALFTAASILPNRPLTALDYRKLLIDLPEVRNAWIEPVPQLLYADPAAGSLHTEKPDRPGIREVSVRGLYRARVDLADGAPEGEQEALDKVWQRLQENRNLCEDFLEPTRVATERYRVCAELAVAPSADTARVHAEVLLRLERYLDPPIYRYSLDEMIERGKPVEEIFDGPQLEHGFFDDDELAHAELRTELRLSDVISLIMDIEGVVAISDVLLTTGTSDPIADKWRIPVPPGRRPTLSHDDCRILFRKRAMPVWPEQEQIETAYAQLVAEDHEKRARAKELASVARGNPGGQSQLDFPIPVGKRRNLEPYSSFQDHFPAVYGLREPTQPSEGPQELANVGGSARAALTNQLRAYLLFFDQIMANYRAQLGAMGDLLSLKDLERTYFHEAVRTFESIYTDEEAVDTAYAQVESKQDASERRNRFLDHLIARFAERFHDYAEVMASRFGGDARSLIAAKCAFLENYPKVGSARGLGFDRARVGGFWQTKNVSGLERRVASLLALDSDANEELLVIESLLLRMDGFAEPLPEICKSPDCTECPEDDPYSYRVHILMPAFAGRFNDMTFRAFAEGVIREETPAHVLPRICWLARDPMQAVQQAYRAWLEARETESSSEAKAGLLQALFTALKEVHNDYPNTKLHACTDGEKAPHFVLGRTRLGEPQSS